MYWKIALPIVILVAVTMSICLVLTFDETEAYKIKRNITDDSDWELTYYHDNPRTWYKRVGMSIIFSVMFGAIGVGICVAIHELIKRD